MDVIKDAPWSGCVDLLQKKGADYIEFSNENLLEGSQYSKTAYGTWTNLGHWGRINDEKTRSVGDLGEIFFIGFH